MQTTEQRIDWLERQIEQVKVFVERDRALLASAPGDFAYQLSLRSWESALAEYTRDLDLLRNAKVRR